MRTARSGFVGALLLGLIVPTVFALLLPEAARLSVARWLYGSSERWPQKTYLTVVGLDDRGRLLAPRDERFLVDVRSDLPDMESRDGRWIIPGRGEPTALKTKPASSKPPREVLIREKPAEGAVRNAAMVATAPGRFRHEFPPSATSSTFELTGGDDWLGPLKVERVDRPYLAGIKLRVKEPGSSAGGFRDIADARQHLVFLPDTQIEMTLTGSEAISAIRLVTHPTTLPKPERVDGKTFTVKWTLTEATSIEVLLTSGETGLASKPAFLSVGLLKDREPRVTLRAIGVGGRVTPVATIPLTVSATDDIGLAGLRLQADRSTSEEGKIEPITKKQTVPLPLASEGGRAVLDTQVRHDVELQVDAPKIGHGAPVHGRGRGPLRPGASGRQVGRAPDAGGLAR